MERSEVDGLRILSIVDQFLISREAPLRLDGKMQVRLRNDFPGLGTPLESFLREMYALPGEDTSLHFCGNDVVEINRDTGISVQGIHLSWNDLLQRIRELIAFGHYMKPTEEKNYQEFKGITVELWENELKKLLESPYPEKRCEAAVDYGAAAWDCLLYDESELVRATVASVADEAHQLRMVRDQSPVVREYLTKEGRHSVLNTLFDVGEKHEDVLVAIAEKASPELQKKMAASLTSENRRTLKILVDRGEPEVIEKILQAPDSGVAACALSQTDREGCLNFLTRDDLNLSDKFEAELRLQELVEEVTVQ